MKNSRRFTASGSRNAKSRRKYAGSLCEAALDSDYPLLSQEIYNAYKIVLEKDLLLHEMPAYLLDMPKGAIDYDEKVIEYFATKSAEFNELRHDYLFILVKYSNQLRNSQAYLP